MDTYKPLEVYQVLDVADYDYSSGVSHNPEIYLAKWYKDEGVEAEKILTFNGVSLTGTYSQTRDDGWYNGIYDICDTTIDGIPAEISFDRNGEYTIYSALQPYEATENEKILSQQECYDIAYPLVKERIPEIDSDNWKSEIKPSSWSCEIDAYSFHWRKYNGDLRTCEFAHIEVLTNGENSVILFFHIGDMDDMKLVPQEVIEAVDKSVYQKLDEIYSTVKDEYISIEHKQYSDTFVTRLPDGRYALEYNIETRLDPVKEDFATICEVNHFVTPLE